MAAVTATTVLLLPLLLATSPPAAQDPSSQPRHLRSAPMAPLREVSGGLRIMGLLGFLVLGRIVVKVVVLPDSPTVSISRKRVWMI